MRSRLNPTLRAYCNSPIDAASTPMKSVSFIILRTSVTGQAFIANEWLQLLGNASFKAWHWFRMESMSYKRADVKESSSLFVY